MSIWIGAGLFLIALAGSAFIIPELRPLHLLQALIYVAIIVLSRRDSPWGYGAGFTIAVFWNAFSLFVTHLMQAGVGELWLLLRTGEAKRPDTMMVLVGGIGHFILIFACLAAIFHCSTDNRRWWKFAGGGILALAYFALIVAVARPVKLFTGRQRGGEYVESLAHIPGPANACNDLYRAVRGCRARNCLEGCVYGRRRSSLRIPPALWDTLSPGRGYRVTVRPSGPCPPIRFYRPRSRTSGKGNKARRWFVPR